MSDRDDLRAEIVRRLRALTGFQDVFDPDAAAEKLGVRVSSIDDLGVAGRFVNSEDGRVIELEAHVGAERKRFTLCHELAHVVIENMSSKTQWRAIVAALQEDEEERLCDRTAAQVLMPSSTTDLDVGSLSLEEVRSYADHQEVSMSAAAARLIETRRLNTVFLRLRRFAAGWFVESAIAAHGLSSLSLSESSTWELDGCLGGTDFEIPLEFVLDGRRRLALCDVQIWHPGGHLAKGQRGSTAVLLAFGMRHWLAKSNMI